VASSRPSASMRSICRCDLSGTLASNQWHMWHTIFFDGLLDLPHYGALWGTCRRWDGRLKKATIAEQTMVTIPTTMITMPTVMYWS